MLSVSACNAVRNLASEITPADVEDGFTKLCDSFSHQLQIVQRFRALDLMLQGHEDRMTLGSRTKADR